VSDCAANGASRGRVGPCGAARGRSARGGAASVTVRDAREIADGGVGSGRRRSGGDRKFARSGGGGGGPSCFGREITALQHITEARSVYGSWGWPNRDKRRALDGTILCTFVVPVPASCSEATNLA